MRPGGPGLVPEGGGLCLFVCLFCVAGPDDATLVSFVQLDLARVDTVDTHEVSGSFFISSVVSLRFVSDVAR